MMGRDMGGTPTCRGEASGCRMRGDWLEGEEPGPGGPDNGPGMVGREEGPGEERSDPGTVRETTELSEKLRQTGSKTGTQSTQ